MKRDKNYSLKDMRCSYDKIQIAAMYICNCYYEVVLAYYNFVSRQVGTPINKNVLVGVGMFSNPKHDSWQKSSPDKINKSIYDCLFLSRNKIEIRKNNNNQKTVDCNHYVHFNNLKRKNLA